jgi:tetratricopeptide (TPR) repeat protein
MAALDNLDVTDSMKNNIEIIRSVINDLGVDPENPGSVSGEQQQKIKSTIAIIDQKIDEIEDYFWRPLDSPEVYEMLKGLAAAVGQEDKVSKFNKKLNRIAANDLEFKGRVQNFFGNNTEALKYYEQAVELASDHELANTGCEKAKKSLAKARIELPKLEKKIIDKPGDLKTLLKYGLIQLDPTNPDAWAKRGTATESLGKYEESKKYFDKALEIKPSSTTAKRGKNYALYFLGELDAEQLD